MNKFEQIAAENDVFKLIGGPGNYTGIVYNPITGQAIERLTGKTEDEVRDKLIRYVYTTIPMSYEEE